MTPQSTTQDETVDLAEVGEDAQLSQLLSEMDSGELQVEAVSISETGYNLVRRC